MSTVIYEFTAKHATEDWATTPENMVDGVETNYAETATDNQIQLLITNECVGTDLGTISKAELRFYGYGDADDQIWLRPVFGGTTDGSDYSVVPGVTAEWKAWQDISNDAAGPLTPSYEYHKTNDTSSYNLGEALWRAQTFTPSVGHDISYVKLKVCRVGSPGTVTVGIRATDGGDPTGADLTSGTFDGDAITEVDTGEWITVTVTPYSLSADTKYAIVVRSVATSVRWRIDAAAGYAEGQALQSIDSGVNWTEPAVRDFMFEEGVTAPAWTWGDVQTLDCDVEFNGVGKKNTAHVGMVQIQVTYTAEAAAEWKQIAYASEPPTVNAWNQVKDAGGSGWVQINFDTD